MLQVGETALMAGAEGNALSSTGVGQHALTAQGGLPSPGKLAAALADLPLASLS